MLNFSTRQKKHVFLKANWENLIHISYSVNKDKLINFLPPNIELDLYGGDAVVTLVAFDFKNTIVKGIPIPFYGNFPEVNLRFNVKDKAGIHKGVVFVREIIPRAGIALVANALYKEHYITMPMKSEMREGSDEIKISHLLHFNKKEYLIEAVSEARTVTPPENSVEDIVKQRNAGFGKSKEGRTLMYKVEHSVWEIFPLKSFVLNLSYEDIFGTYWKFLSLEKPLNVMLAKGSSVRVYEWQYYKA